MGSVVRVVHVHVLSVVRTAGTARQRRLLGFRLAGSVQTRHSSELGSELPPRSLDTLY